MLTALLDNDRYSLIKDLKKPVRSRNLFDALQHEYPQYSLADAVSHGVAIRDRVMARYLQLRVGVLADASDDLVQYMTGLDLIVSGNISFAATAVRYLLPASPHTVTITDRPARPDSDTGVLPCPTIAWWWDPLAP